MDEMDAEPLDRRRRYLRHRLAVDPDLAGIGLVDPGKDFDYGRFSGAVLTDPWTVPFATFKSASTKAWTAPKVLVILIISRASVWVMTHPRGREVGRSALRPTELAFTSSAGTGLPSRRPCPW
jgi:hypothetical protein